MPLLSLSGTNDPPWYPVSIARLEGLLEKAIQTGHGYHTAKALRKNIAYNLQYLEFLDRSFQDLKLSGVLKTQTWKVFIIVSCGIIESLLHYLLVRRGLHTTTEWELKVVLPGNTKNVDGEPIKADVHISKKLSKPRLKQMTFDSMIQKAQTKCLLGSKMDLYKDLDQLRDLRNKVHLQAIDEPNDTDWNTIHIEHLRQMYNVVHGVFTSTIFRPSAEEVDYFEYLRKIAKA